MAAVTFTLSPDVPIDEFPPGVVFAWRGVNYVVVASRVLDDGFYEVEAELWRA